MNVPGHLKEAIDVIVVNCIAKAERHFGRKYNAIRVEYEVRGRKGGYAMGDEYINLNPVLLVENTTEYLEQVVPHEVAHCIDSANGDNQRPEGVRFTRSGRMRRMKRSVHGPTWKRIMVLFGCDPDQRCHQMDTTNSAVRTKTKYEYQCLSCKQSIFVSSVRHNKQRRHALEHPGSSFYTCKRCGRTRGTLKFIANRGQVSFEQAREASKKGPVRFTADHIPPHMLPPKVREDVGLSFQERGRKVFGMYQHLGRQLCIRKMVEIGIKDTTASTYYQNFRSGK